jgi:hypothetical protein
VAEPGLQALLDRQAILDCLVRFSRGMDRYDRDLVFSAFHPDAVCDYGPYVGDPEGLYAWAVALKASIVCVHHHLTNHSCEIAGDTAHAETYMIYNARYADETLWQAHGRYIDRLERRDGEWKIAMRYCVIEAAGPTGTCTLPFTGIDDIAANGAPSLDRSDPSYLRPLANRRKLRAFDS